MIPKVTLLWNVSVPGGTSEFRHVKAKYKLCLTSIHGLNVRATAES